MRYRELIHSSWLFTQENKRLIIWYSFLPSLLTTLIGLLYVIYQYFAFKTSRLFSDEKEGFLFEVAETCITFLKEDPKLGLILGGIAAIIGIGWLLLPTICQGALIQLVARIQNKQDVKLIDGIYYGLKSFLPLFKYHLLIRSFGFISILTEGSFVARNLGLEWLKLLMIFFTLFTIIGLILGLLFTYTEYFIVIDRYRVFKSIAASCNLVLKHWRETFLIIILMTIITIQIIIRLAMVILLPALIVFSTAYLASVMLAKIGLIIGITVGFIAMLFAAYFTGIIHVFATSVWVETFLYLTSQKEPSARKQGN